MTVEDSYQLAIDTQAETYLQLRQKLTYFIVTASIVVISFALNFYIEHEYGSALLHKLHGIILAVAAVCALTASGMALISLHFGHLSFRKHLEARYAKKEWLGLTQHERDVWNRVNKATTITLFLSYTFLFGEILVLLIFFWPIFI